jgi:hypothetical protein
MKRSGVRISYAPLFRDGLLAEHALDLVEQAATQRGQIGSLAGQQRIDHALVLGGHLGFHEFGDGLERAIDLLCAQSKSCQFFFEFVHGAKRKNTGNRTRTCTTVFCLLNLSDCRATDRAIDACECT